MRTMIEGSSQSTVIEILKDINESNAAQKTRSFLLGSKELSSTKPWQAVWRLQIINTIVMVACVVIGLMSQYNEAGRYFREGRLVTWISTFQLIAVGYICHRVWFLLNNNNAPFSLKNPAAVWKFAAYGFYFLGLDEILKIHEELDRYGHKLFGVDPNGLTDHIDDLIVALYALSGLALVVMYWKHLWKYIGAITFGIGACIAAFISIVLDYVSGDRGLLTKYYVDRAATETAMERLGLIEEFFKIYAEVFFIGAALYCFLKAIEDRKTKTSAIS